MHRIGSSIGNPAGWSNFWAFDRTVVYGMNQTLPAQRRSFWWPHLAMFYLSLNGTPTESRSIGTSPRLVKWKIDSWVLFRYRLLVIGLKCPTVLGPIVSDFAHLIVFCNVNVFLNARPTSNATQAAV